MFRGEFFVLMGWYRLDRNQITRDFVQADDNFVALTLIHFEFDLVLIQLIGVPLSFEGCLEHFLAKLFVCKVNDSIVARFLRDLDRVKRPALTLRRRSSLSGGRRVVIFVISFLELNLHHSHVAGVQLNLSLRCIIFMADDFEVGTVQYQGVVSHLVILVCYETGEVLGLLIILQRHGW